MTAAAALEAYALLCREAGYPQSDGDREDFVRFATEDGGCWETYLMINGDAVDAEVHLEDDDTLRVLAPDTEASVYWANEISANLQSLRRVFPAISPIPRERLSSLAQ